MTVGAFYMIAASFVFSVSYSFIKVMTQELGFWEAAFLRGTFGVLLLFIILRYKHQPWLGRRENVLPVLLRGLFGGTAMILYFWSLRSTTLANASSLHYAHPLFTVFLAVPILKERLYRTKVLLVIGAMSGVLLIIQPSPQHIDWGAFPAFISAFFASLAYISIRFVATKEHWAPIVNALSVFTMVLSAPMAIVTWKTPSPRVWGFIVAAGVGTTLAQYLMTMAYKLQEASTVAAFSFTSILWSTAIGTFIFGEVPGTMETAGILVLFVCLVMLVRLRPMHTQVEGSK